MALKRDGTVWAWGDNYTQECGICEFTQVPVVEPVQIEELSDIIAIDAGVQHGVALKPDGTVWCWGLGLFGILGQGAGDNYTGSCVPLQVVNLSGVTAIAAGADHTLALLSDGTVKGWGQGNCGQLGFGYAFSLSEPTFSRGMTDVVAIAAGSGHSVYLKSDGTVWGTGANDQGQLGVGPRGLYLPTLIPGIAGATAIGVGRAADRSFVQTGDGGLWLLGRVGVCGTSTTPVTLMPLPAAQSFTVSTRHMVVLEGPPRPRPPGLSSMRKRAGPYRIEATGYGLQPGFQVFLDDDDTPWTHLKIVSPTQFILKGGDKLQARVKKKHPFPFRIVNPDGGQVRVLWEFKKNP
jgi:hypothetical protein